MARSALLYVILVFAAGTVLGTIRTLVVLPLIGPLPAVLVEIPLMLALSWWSLRLVLRLRPVPPVAMLRIGMGVLAFAFLMIAEFILATLLGGLDPAGFVAGLVRPEGLAGLAAQLVFAALPLLRLPLDRSRTTA